MKALVTVHQLESEGGSFLNVMNDIGKVGVWGSTYETPTILAIKGATFNLISFDTENYYKEWFEKNKNKFDYFYIVTSSGVEMYYAKQ
jgi:hypothetical protein